MAKPADFFVGAMDFFAILLPGAALVYLVQPWTLQFLPNDLLPRGEAQSWVIFLILAYIVGHLLHAAGDILDKQVYDGLYVPCAQPAHAKARTLRGRKDWRTQLEADDEASKTLVGRSYLRAGEDAAGTKLYDWCLSLVRLRKAAAAAEVDRYQADSKFFRSLVFVFAVAFAVAAGKSQLIAAIAALLAATFSLFRYCRLRWDATKRLYEYYLLFHRYGDVTEDD